MQQAVCDLSSPGAPRLQPVQPRGCLSRLCQSAAVTQSGQATTGPAPRRRDPAEPRLGQNARYPDYVKAERVPREGQPQQHGINDPEAWTNDYTEEGEGWDDDEDDDSLAMDGPEFEPPRAVDG